MTSDAPGQFPSLAFLETELSAAMTALGVADADERAARQRALTARAALNVAQKALDDAMLRLRSDAPHGTDWRGNRGEPAE